MCQAVNSCKRKNRCMSHGHRDRDFHRPRDAQQKLQGYKCPISSGPPLGLAPCFATPWTAARQASLPITNSQNLLKLMSIESVMPSNHHPLSPPLPSAFNLAQHQGLFTGITILQFLNLPCPGNLNPWAQTE